jgi:signal transduction histidine kinase
LGLGLAIVGSIVKVHGGTMGIVSEVGQGTRVMLVFPGAIIDASERQGIDTATTISQTAGV